MKGEKLNTLADQLGGGWRVVDEHHLEKEYRFPDFRRALDFTVAAGEIAEQEGHHPDILLSWGKARVTIYTHKIDGLTESDFVLAAKLDEALGAEDAASSG
jgi:4a-hydroxytetrahydrobiopterin dehydratase